MSLIPPFTEDGLLPVGDYQLTIGELSESMLVNGPGNESGWDVSWRRTLVVNFGILVGHLWRIGIGDIFLDGSFVESKPHPNDIDGYFVCDKEMLISGELETRLQTFDPVWTWSRRYATAGSSKRQLPMWHRYRVELFPHIGQGTGIVDQFGYELEFPSAFRQSRDFRPKGIVKIGGPT